MRRLLQIGTLLFLLIMFLSPLTEYFDRYDAPGLASDTELAAFLLIFALCLVLIVSMLTAARSMLRDLALGCVIQLPTSGWVFFEAELLLSIFIPPRLLPLRI